MAVGGGEGGLWSKGYIKPLESNNCDNLFGQNGFGLLSLNLCMAIIIIMLAEL